MTVRRRVFQEALDLGEEVQIDLLRAAYPCTLSIARPWRGRRADWSFVPDVYGRDAKIWLALQREGVVMGDDHRINGT